MFVFSQSLFRPVVGSILFVLVGLSAPTLAGSDGGKARLKALVEKVAQQEAGEPAVIPGISAAVYRGGFMAEHYFAGFSNPTSEPVEMTTLVQGHDRTIMVPPKLRILPMMAFEWASITKTATAAMVLRLAHENPEILDQTLRKWLPTECSIEELNCPPGDGLYCPSIRDLLGMVSGIPDFGAKLNETFVPQMDPAHDLELQPLTLNNPMKFWLPRFVLYELDRENNPRQNGFSYANTNFVLLGMILEDMTNNPDLNHSYREMFDDAKLKRVFLGGYDHIKVDFRALGWNKNAPGRDRRAFVTAYWTAGGLVGTAGDAARWLYQLNQPGVVLSKPSLELIHDFHTETDIAIDKNFHITGYSLGLMRLRARIGEKDLIMYGHTGCSSAFLSIAAYIPEYNLSFSILVNKHSSSTRKEFFRLVQDFIAILAESNS